MAIPGAQSQIHTAMGVEVVEQERRLTCVPADRDAIFIWEA